MDTDGFLAEGPGWNILLVKDGEILSPEPRNILLGVSRGMVFDLANDLGIPVREANLGRYEGLMADEVFCTATTYGMVHATTFEGQSVGDGSPGPVFTRLIESWKDQVGVDFVAQALDYADRLPEWEQQNVTINAGS